MWTRYFGRVEVRVEFFTQSTAVEMSSIGGYLELSSVILHFALNCVSVYFLPLLKALLNGAFSISAFSVGSVMSRHFEVRDGIPQAADPCSFMYVQNLCVCVLRGRER